MVGRAAAGRAGLLTGSVLLALGTLAASMATYSTSSTSAASLATSSCYYRATVQRGSTTSTTNGITSVTITAVDTAKSFLMFTTRHNSNRPVASEIGGRLASSTTLEFRRDTDEGAPATMTIEWSVVSYVCGVTVQRGSVVQTGTTVDVTITAVPSAAQAFVLWSKNVAPADQTWDGNDPVIGDLTSTTNLQFRSDAANSGHTIWWEVVAFADASMIRVQRGTSSLTGGATSATFTTASTFDASRTFLLVGWRGPATTNMASSLLRGQLTAPSTVTIDRAAGTYDLSEVAYQAVELFDGTLVRTSSLTFTPTILGTGVPFAAMDLSRTTAFASTQTGGGQNGGLSDYTADDVVGTAAFTLAITSATNVSVLRAFSGGTTSVAFYTVSWGLA